MIIVFHVEVYDKNKMNSDTLIGKGFEQISKKLLMPLISNKTTSISSSILFDNIEIKIFDQKNKFSGKVKLYIERENAKVINGSPGKMLRDLRLAKYMWEHGEVMYGDFLDNNINGHGLYVWENGEGWFDNTCTYDQTNTIPKFIDYHNSDIFEGYWKDDMKDSKGIKLHR